MMHVGSVARPCLKCFGRASLCVLSVLARRKDKEEVWVLYVFYLVWLICIIILITFNLPVLKLRMAVVKGQLAAQHARRAGFVTLIKADVTYIIMY